jgi:hypothetical protein
VDASAGDVGSTIGVAIAASLRDVMLCENRDAARDDAIG